MTYIKIDENTLEKQEMTTKRFDLSLLKMERKQLKISIEQKKERIAEINEIFEEARLQGIIISNEE